jgi:hypothetical protein
MPGSPVPVGLVFEGVWDQCVRISIFQCMRRAPHARRGTIDDYMQVPQMVVASVLDDDGNQVFPRKWNNEFIDLPIVESTKQTRPSFSMEVMNGVARWKDSKVRMVFILAGAAGGRIGETRGLELHKHFSSDYRTIKPRPEGSALQS